MIGKIINKTKGRPCSCPQGKQCDGCKKKRVIKPSVYIEEPRRLPVPIKVTEYREHPKTSIIVTRKSPRSSITQWYTQRQEKKQSRSPKTVNKSPICRWYKRQKALKELKDIRKREKELEQERARQEREAEILRLLEQEERAKRAREIELEKAQKKKEEQEERLRRAREIELEKAQKKKEEEAYEVFKKQAEVVRKTELEEEKKPKKVKKAKEKKPKKRTTKAGPRRRLARFKQKLPCDVRFVNCCYRFCCQFYCWLTIILLLGLGVMFYL